MIERDPNEVKMENFIRTARKAIPVPTVPPKKRSIITPYVHRSHTIGKEIPEALPFDDYFTFFVDKKQEEFPHINEIKVFYNSEKIFGIQPVYQQSSEVIIGNIYVGSEAEFGFDIASIKLDPSDYIVEVSGEYSEIINRLRFRSKNGQVLEVGGYAPKKFKSLISSPYRLLFLGGTLTTELRSLYCYF